MKAYTISSFAFALTLTFAACGSSHPKPNPVDAPAPKVDPTPAPAPAPTPLKRLAGDDEVPDRFRRQLSDFLNEPRNASYDRVLEVHNVSNATAIVLESKVEDGGACFVGKATLDIMADDAGKVTDELQSFGQDCCPGTTCAVQKSGWNLRYLDAVAKKDNAALSLLVPAKKKLTYTLKAGAAKPSKKTFTRKDIAGGKLANPPGCGFVESRPSCDDADAKTGAFQCHCMGGGYNVTYGWEKEGDAMVLTTIDEQSE